MEHKEIENYLVSVGFVKNEDYTTERTSVYLQNELNELQLVAESDGFLCFGRKYNLGFNFGPMTIFNQAKIRSVKEMETIVNVFSFTYKK